MQNLFQWIRSKHRTGWKFQFQFGAGSEVLGDITALGYLRKIPHISDLVPLGHYLTGVDLDLIDANFLTWHATRYSWYEGSRCEIYAADKTGKPIVKARGSNITSLFFGESVVDFVRRLERHKKKDVIAFIIVATLAYRPHTNVYLRVGKFPQALTMATYVEGVLEASRIETEKKIGAAALLAEFELA
jgi:hypothetical protein